MAVQINPEDEDAWELIDIINRKLQNSIKKLLQGGNQKGVN
jgi:hypothetical protein